MSLCLIKSSTLKTCVGNVIWLNAVIVWAGHCVDRDGQLRAQFTLPSRERDPRLSGEAAGRASVQWRRGIQRSLAPSENRTPVPRTSSSQRSPDTCLGT